MEARRVIANPAVADDEGFVAVERGPIVYCAEAPDNGGRALNIVLTDKTLLKADDRPDLLGGVTVLAGDGPRRRPRRRSANGRAKVERCRGRG